MWQALTTVGGWQGEIWNKRKNGEVFPEWLSINAILDDAGKLTQYAAIFTDITERKRIEERVKNLAYFDVLTGMPNRRLFTDRLQVAIANAHRHTHRLAIMFIDLDLFKRINDTLGHGIGDLVLIESARRLAKTVREGDTVARLGGDEFVVLMPELEEVEDVAKLAERIICNLRQPFVVEEHELYVTASIGVAALPRGRREGRHPAEECRHRHVPGQGSRPQQLPAVHPGNERPLVRAPGDGIGLRHALVRGEFVLAYQVKLDLATGSMSGVEALVRWHHPEMGLVSPVDFIPLAEDMGLISDSAPGC